MRACIRWLLRLAFRVQVNGELDVLAQGPHVVVANCDSAMDGVLLGLFLPRRPLVVGTDEMRTRRLPRWLMRWVHSCANSSQHPRSLDVVVRHVQSGGVAVIFPQGCVASSGAVMSIDDAAAMVVAQCGVEVVPVRISGTLFSRYAGTSRRWPRRFFPQVTISVLDPVSIARPSDETTKGARRERALALQSVMQHLVCHRPVQRNLFSAFIDALELHGRNTRIIEDARQQPESYGQLLKIALALGRLVSRHSGAGERVGVLMPTMSTTLGLLLGLTAHGRVAAMLNYTAGAEGMQSACVTAGVRTVITSRQFLAALDIRDLADKLTGITLLYLEDLRPSFTPRDKLWLMGFALWFPRAVVPQVDPQQPAVVLFTSGSEGMPKGVVLSHAAMLANMSQLQTVIDFGPDDKFFSALPLFHIFGLVACGLMPLMTGTRLFIYVSPLRYRTIPALVHTCGATYLFGTSTLLSHYARQAQAGDFQSLRKVISGGEKLSSEVVDLWHEKFGLRVLEGYGATECGPAMSLNTPFAFKRHAVGCFLPGIEYRMLPVEGISKGGALHVRGPNLMSGYLTSEQPGVLVPPRSAAGAGWHETGDVVDIDAEGFVTIVGRTRRFAKIAGEMISLDAAERVAFMASPAHRHAALLEQIPEYGESSVLFTTDAALDRAALMRAARDCGVSDLTAARRIVCVNDLPLLGNGKTDYLTLSQRYVAHAIGRAHVTQTPHA